MFYTVGSRLLNLQNKSSDYDFFKIYKDKEESKTDYKKDITFLQEQYPNSVVHLDFRIKKDLESYLGCFCDNIKKIHCLNYKTYLYKYQLDSSIIGQNFPYEFHILNYKKQMIEVLYYIGFELNFAGDKGLFEYYKKGFYKTFINLTKKRNITFKEQDYNVIPKVFYHFMYTLFIFKNNSTSLTNEQINILKEIRNRKKPLKFLDVVAEELLTLYNQ